MYDCDSFSRGVRTGLQFYNGVARATLLRGVQQLVAALDHEAVIVECEKNLRLANEKWRKFPSPRLAITIENLQQKLAGKDEAMLRLTAQLREYLHADALDELRFRLHAIVENEPDQYTGQPAGIDVEDIILFLEEIPPGKSTPPVDDFPVRLQVSSYELFSIWELETRYRRWDRREGFSTNSDQEIWLFEGYGPTPIHRRVYVHGYFPLVDLLAQKLRQIRPSGGRFVISPQDAAYCPTSGSWTQFAIFEYTDE